MKNHFYPKQEGEEEEEEKDTSSEDELRDVDEVLKQAETMLKKRRRPIKDNEENSPNDFDSILT